METEAAGGSIVTHNQERVKVAFRVNGGADLLMESLYALPVGVDMFCLDNSPFYAYGVSFADIVYAPISDGTATFLKVVEHRGHSTYRVRLPVGQDHKGFLDRWSELAALGCTFEGSGRSARRLYSIDIAPTVDLNSVYKVLSSGEANGWWEFEEAHYCVPSSVKPSM